MWLSLSTTARITTATLYCSSSSIRTRPSSVCWLPFLSSRRRSYTRQQQQTIAAKSSLMTTEISDTEILIDNVRIPPRPDYQRTHRSRVEHMIAPRTDYASVLISEALNIPINEVVLPLITRFGAVFSCAVVPTLPNNIHSELAQKARDDAILRVGKHSSHHQPRRISQDMIIEANSYIRVHLVPKRFPAYYDVDWKSRIIYNGIDFVVVDKPGAVPVVATVDNLLENVPMGISSVLQEPIQLLPTHRLDHATEGVLMLAKNKDFVSYFNTAIQKGAVTKWYRCVSFVQVPLGSLVHHMIVNRRCPGLPSHSLILLDDDDDDVEISKHKDAVHAELIVLNCRPVTLSKPAAQLYGCTTAWETELELVTGRTHQIRAQLSAIGCPLLGDDLYQPLQSREIRAQLLNGIVPAAKDGDANGRILNDPAGSIGLQAWKMKVDGLENTITNELNAVFEAATPWWRAV